MPKKSVREMSAVERRSNSLGGRMFRLVLLLAVIIGVSAASFGFYLYDNAVLREFRVNSWQISKTAAFIANRRHVETIYNEVIPIYESAEAEGVEINSVEYLSRFRKVITNDHNYLRYLLHNIQSENKAMSVYIGVIDKEKERMIYLVDSDTTKTHRNPGYCDEMLAEEYDIYINGAKITALDRLLDNTLSIPADESKTEEYGYLCTAGSVIQEGDRYVLVAFADLDMEDVEKAKRTFMEQFFMLLLLVTVIAAQLITMRLNRTVVQPINQMADAAKAYSYDHVENIRDSRHFDSLDIRTGDEIENLSLLMKEMENEIQDNIRRLEVITADKERINTELNIAARIQEGMVPHEFPAFPDRLEFDLIASMDPAREVGGDFYDFYMIDHDHLALVIADVTGKGIPAALFMMVSKILIATIGNKPGVSPARILSRVNETICKNNPTEMFVTIWLGILEISTGIVRCANGGHEYPVVYRKDKGFEVFKDPHGFVIGGMPDSQYHDYEIKLEPGDMIFQYTDGVTDAINASDEIFGDERMVEALNTIESPDPKGVLQKVTEEVEQFTEGEPQFDDITMICLQYKGTDAEKESLIDRSIDIEAMAENWPQVSDFIEQQLNAAGCPVKEKNHLLIAAEEIFSNISKFAYAPDKGEAVIRVNVQEDPLMVTLTFMDHGVQFDPLDRKDPDVTLSAEDREIGGLGLFIVKNTMDEVSYRYVDGMNILTLKKSI